MSNGATDAAVDARSARRSFRQPVHRLFAREQRHEGGRRYTAPSPSEAVKRLSRTALLVAIEGLAHRATLRHDSGCRDL